MGLHYTKHVTAILLLLLLLFPHAIVRKRMSQIGASHRKADEGKTQEKLCPEKCIRLSDRDFQNSVQAGPCLKNFPGP